MRQDRVQPAVELSGVSKQFGPVQALRGVDLVLYPGEVHALVGENGAGKSTLVKMLAGIHQPDQGTIRVDGEPVAFDGPLDARSRGIAVIHQHPTLFPDLDVAENIYMGRQPRDRVGRIDWRAMYAEVGRLLATLGEEINVRAPVRALAVADQQLVEIAKALSLNARVLVMDEPTASLSAREVDRLFAIVRRLRDQGVAILFVGHRLEALFPKEDATIGDVLLQVRGLTQAGVFRDISFELRRGEILGLFGLVGAGRTEVARVLFGADQADSGT